MKSLNKIILGLLFIFIGVIVLLNSLEVVNINLFFTGWWTLFIIIPSFIGLFNDDDKTGNIIGLIVGILLLLMARDIISLGMLIKLFFPLILIVIGLNILFKETINSKINEKIKNKHKDLEHITATFGEQKVVVDEKYQGSNVDAIFGVVKLDLKKAILDKETVIKASSIFGGITIILPKDATVKIKATPIFGGVNNQYQNNSESDKVVYIDALALFGGVDIKWMPHKK